MMQLTLIERSYAPTALPSWRIKLVQDKSGPIEFTRSANRALVFTWLGGIAALFAIIIGTVTVIGYAKSEKDEVFNAGMKAAQVQQAAADEANKRHQEAEEFRSYEKANDANVAAMQERQSRMLEMLMQALGQTPPPAAAHERANRPLKPNGTAFWLHVSPDGTCCLKRVKCDPGLPDCMTDIAK